MEIFKKKKLGGRPQKGDTLCTFRVMQKDKEKHRATAKKYGFSNLAEYIRFLLKVGDAGFSISKAAEEENKTRTFLHK